ncbi:hypothetical protein PM082_003590 [Marasmius tenuissimus]|nr:hypothetical protein PM082_003590 [Marasmius tenuissimus]
MQRCLDEYFIAIKCCWRGTKECVEGRTDTSGGGVRHEGLGQRVDQDETLGNNNSGVIEGYSAALKLYPWELGRI